jgi:hypothetical protein
VGNWLDLSYAQFGSGAITFILEKVRAINQMRRDGMWYFGDVNYIEENIEYSSWAIRQGFPYSYIWSVDEAGALLKALADRSETGVEFRKGIAASATTYIGDGVNYKNGVGDIGDRAFTIENSFAKYFCDGIYSPICNLLDEAIVSSAEQCLSINDIYIICSYEVFLTNTCKDYFLLCLLYI